MELEDVLSKLYQYFTDKSEKRWHVQFHRKSAYRNEQFGEKGEIPKKDFQRLFPELSDEAFDDMVQKLEDRAIIVKIDGPALFFNPEIVYTKDMFRNLRW